MTTKEKPAKDTMPANYVFEDKAKLSAEFKAIEGAAYKLTNRIHRAGVSALWHLSKHGDIMQVNTAYLALSGKATGVRSAAFASWILAHGALKANEGEDKKVKPFVYDKSKKTNVEAAYAEGWWEHMPEKKPDQIFDLQTAIRDLIKRAEKSKQIEHAEMLPALKSLVVIGAVHSAEKKVEAGETLTPTDDAALAAGKDAGKATAAATAVH